MAAASLLSLVVVAISLHGCASLLTDLSRFSSSTTTSRHYSVARLPTTTTKRRVTRQKQQHPPPLYAVSPPFEASSSSEAIRRTTEGRAGEADRFDRTAPVVACSDEPCILTIDGVRYNVTAWARSHPGGLKILQKFHDKDATKAFYGAAHSQKAVELLRKFAIVDDESNDDRPPATTAATSSTKVTITKEGVAASSSLRSSNKPRWIQKLFTHEDPYGVHKTLGVFVLLNFVFRFGQMYFGDPTAGLGHRLGNNKGIGFIIAPLCLIPHALLSLSSLIFRTVPRERIVGKPMIWKEYRVHNIAFGLRSVVCAFLGWLSVAKNHAPAWRRTAVWGACITAVAALAAADEGTRRLRAHETESTTATMPYWEGCSSQTQRKFKSFYAYCQFMATLACVMVGNPACALAVLIPIQLASLLMTLVRKGIISAKGYHVGYTVTLCMPYLVALRSMLVAVKNNGPAWEYPSLFVVGWAFYQLRRRRVNKYLVWGPFLLARALYGDRLITYDIW